MKYSVYPTPSFKHEAKRLLKKFASLKEELSVLQKELEENPKYGIDIGNNTYKVRLAIKSKQKGKSGGARVITYLINDVQEVYLLKIYDKSELDDISDKELKRLVDDVVNGS